METKLTKEECYELADRLLSAMDDDPKVRRYVENRLTHVRRGKRWKKQRKAWRGQIASTLMSGIVSKSFKAALRANT